MCNRWMIPALALLMWTGCSTRGVAVKNQSGPADIPAEEVLVSSFDNATLPTAPQAPRQAKEIVVHGQTRVDEYAWMKDDNWQKVLREPEVLREDIRKHLEAENAYYAGVMEPQEALRKTLVAEMRGRIKEDDSSIPAPDGPFDYYVRYREGGQYAIYARRTRGEQDGAETVLFDGDAEGKDKAFFSIGTVDWSPNHEMIAYSVDDVGSEYYTLRVRDIATGQERKDVIESTGGNVVWAADNKTLFYVERDDNQRPKRVKRHVLGTPASDDVVVYDEPDNGFFLDISKSQSTDYIFITAAGHTSGEVRYIPAANPTADPVLIAERIAEQKYTVEHRGDSFYIRTNADGAVDFKIVKAPVATPGRDHWVDWTPHEPGRYLLGMATLKDYFVRLERKNALPAIVISDYDGNEHEIEFDEAAYDLGVNPGYEFDTDSIRFTYESPSTPEQTYRYSMASRDRSLLKTQEVPSGHDSSLYVVDRIDSISADGAKVPMTILRLKTTPVDGSAPVVLYGYGSYGYMIDAGFSTSVLSLVDRGAIYATAHIRGGTARGYQWYLDGKRDKKINTFTDFVSAGRTLVDRGYTRPGRIVIYGGSAGGLLVGAAVNLAPELFGGVIGAVPFVDVLNTMSDTSLPLTPPEWPEWGNPIEDSVAYGWIAEYSPYDNIAKTNYPPVLATGGLADYRVTYWEPAKWIARLREQTTGGPFLLKMEMDAGHGGSAARFKRLEERAHLYAFALRIFGLESAEPASHGK